MIIGHGIDLQETAAIKRAMKNPRFAQKVLTDQEYDHFLRLKGQRQVDYLAGRWAAKEAFAKALGTGIGKVGFRDIEVLNDDKGAPFLLQSVIFAKVWLSISHSGNFVQASVILEEEDESKSS